MTNKEMTIIPPEGKKYAENAEKNPSLFLSKAGKKPMSFIMKQINAIITLLILFLALTENVRIISDVLQLADVRTSGGMYSADGNQTKVEETGVYTKEMTYKGETCTYTFPTEKESRNVMYEAFLDCPSFPVEPRSGLKRKYFLSKVYKLLAEEREHLLQYNVDAIYQCEANTARGFSQMITHHWSATRWCASIHILFELSTTPCEDIEVPVERVLPGERSHDTLFVRTKSNADLDVLKEAAKQAYITEAMSSNSDLSMADAEAEAEVKAEAEPENGGFDIVDLEIIPSGSLGPDLIEIDGPCFVFADDVGLFGTRHTMLGETNYGYACYPDGAGGQKIRARFYAYEHYILKDSGAVFEYILHCFVVFLLLKNRLQLYKHITLIQPTFSKVWHVLECGDFLLHQSEKSSLYSLMLLTIDTILSRQMLLSAFGYLTWSSNRSFFQTTLAVLRMSKLAWLVVFLVTLISRLINFFFNMRVYVFREVFAVTVLITMPILFSIDFFDVWLMTAAVEALDDKVGRPMLAPSASRKVAGSPPCTLGTIFDALSSAYIVAFIVVPIIVVVQNIYLRQLASKEDNPKNCVLVWAKKHPEVVDTFTYGFIKSHVDEDGTLSTLSLMNFSIQCVECAEGPCLVISDKVVPVIPLSGGYYYLDEDAEPIQVPGPRYTNSEMLYFGTQKFSVTPTAEGVQLTDTTGAVFRRSSRRASFMHSKKTL